MGELGSNGNGNGAGKNSVNWRDLLTPVVGMLISILLLGANTTLSDIKAQLAETQTVLIDHEKRLSTVETKQADDHESIVGLEGRERAAWERSRLGLSRVIRSNSTETQ